MLFSIIKKAVLRQRTSPPTRVESPLISVLIAAYNHAEFVTATIESIWQQNYPNLEIVAIDDCSSDNTYSVLQDLTRNSPMPMTIMRNDRNQGAAKTFNRAAALAKGAYYSIFSSDDLMTPNRFERQASLLNADHNLQIVYGRGLWLYQDKTKPCDIIHGQEATSLLQQNASNVAEYLLTHASPLFLQASLMRRELFENVGGFDSEVISDDWVLTIRIFRYLADHPELRHAIHFEHVFDYRAHAAQIWRNHNRQLAAKWQVLEKYTPHNLQVEASNNVICRHLDLANAHIPRDTYVDYAMKLARLHSDRGAIRSALSWAEKAHRVLPGEPKLRSLVDKLKQTLASEDTPTAN